MQVDTVHIGLAPGKTIRHFTGYCPVAKWTVGKAYNRATAASAKLFLDKLKADLPFTLEGIQVDGGSEFMAGFEAACQVKKIKLYVPCRRACRNSTAASSDAMARGATSSMPAPTCPAPSRS